jgi:hypothetical protein
MYENLFTYTFRGVQGVRPFSTQIVASTEKKARKRILLAVQNEAKTTDKKAAERILKNIFCYPESKNFSEKIDDFTGNYCQPPRKFFKKIFDNPCRQLSEKDFRKVIQLIGYINPNYIPSDVANFIKKVTIKLILNWERLVSFDEWIKIVPVEVRPFSLFEVRIYSCLDG